MIKTVLLTPIISAVIVTILGVLSGIMHFEIFSILMVSFAVLSWGCILSLVVLLPLYKLGLERTRYLVAGSVIISVGVLVLYFVNPDSHFYLMVKEKPMLYLKIIWKEVFYGAFSGVILTSVFYWLATHNQSLKRDCRYAPAP